MLVEDLLKHFQKHDWDWCKKHSIELTPQILRLTSQTKGFNYFFNLYLNNTPFKDLDVNVIRQFQTKSKFILPASFKDWNIKQKWNKWKVDNPALYNQFFKPHQRNILFKETKHKK